MGTSQNFKSTVSFGGRIDPSFRRSTEGLQDAIRQTGQTVGALTRRQEKLGAQIKRMKLAGQDVSRLVSDYQRLGREINHVTEDQERLNRQMRRHEGMARWRGRAGMAAKWSASKAWNGAAAAGLAFSGASVGALTSLSATAEKLALARGYGVGIEKYNAWNSIAARGGLNGENVGDLAEELTNKMGEKGNEKALNPLLAQLNLSKRRMTGWNREKQFNEVMDRLVKLKDDRQAASLGDQLMGGEANKILTYIRSTGKSWSETMAEAQKTNHLTKEGAEGAAKAHFALTNAWASISSAAEDVIGKMGAELEPEIKKFGENFSKEFTEWAKPDKSGKTGLERLKGQLVTFGKSVEQAGEIAFAVAKKFSWILPDTDAQKIAHWKESVANGAISPDVAAALAAKEGLSKEWEKEGITRDKARQMREQRDKDWQPPEFMRDGMEWLRSKLYNSAGATQQNQNNITINVTAAPGQSPETVGENVYQTFQDSLKTHYPTVSASGAMYDLPGG